MRKIILIVLSMLVPFGLWTAGCRQDRDTAFPNTPEMNNLAFAPEADNPTRPPVIPAAPIDRDILNLPERNTMARINATNDRANAMAGSRVNPGLFVLPESGARMAALPENEQVWDPYRLESPAAAPAMAAVPAPVGREFYSRPAAPVRNAPQNIPADVYAMAAPSPRESFIAPPPPVAAPPRGGYGQGALFPPEDIPGLFLDGADGMEGAAGAHPPSVPGWIGMGDTRGDALGAPPLLSSAAFASVPADTIGERMRDSAAEGEPAAAAGVPGPIKLDLAGLLGSMKTIADTVVPAHDYDGAERRASPEHAVAMTEWQPAEKWSSAKPMPAAPRAGENSRRISQSRLDELREALAPLPDITSPGRAPADEYAFRAAPLTMPAPMPETEMGAALEAARSMLLDYAPELRENVAAAPLEDRDVALMRTVFDDLMPMVPPLVEPVPVAVPEMAAARNAGEAPSLPKSLVMNIPAPDSFPAEKKNDEPFWMSIPPLAVPELPLAIDELPELSESPMPNEPQKIRLEPVAAAAGRTQIAAVDATVEVPPLRF